MSVYLGVRACEVFLCFVAIVRVRPIMLASLYSLFTSLVSGTGSCTEDEPKMVRVARFSCGFFTATAGNKKIQGSPRHFYALS